MLDPTPFAEDGVCLALSLGYRRVDLTLSSGAQKAFLVLSF